MDKIRILWINDQHEGFPESELPARYRKYFEIIDPRPKTQGPYSSDYSFPSAEHFVQYLKRFWFDKDTSMLPCEILVTDYDLSRFPGEESPRGDGKNFNGLIITSLYSCLTHRHPSTLVPTTAYLESLSKESGVRTLHKLAEPFVGTRFEQNLGALERSWENILRISMPHLRDRIRLLHEKHQIAISVKDLETVIDAKGPSTVLTIQSPFAIRLLPVEGLFIDVEDENKRSLAIQEWAEKLFENIVDRTSFKTALQIVDKLWAFYIAAEGTHEQTQLRNRRLLSDLLRKGHTGSEVDNLKELCSATESGCEVCAEIRNNRYSDDIRRLVVVLMAFRLVTYMLRVGAKLQKFDLHVGFPGLIENDLWFALFPLPRNPVMLPDSIPSYRDNSWERLISRLNLSIPDILQGKPCSKDRKLKGLRPSERHLLKALATDERDLVSDGKLEDSVFHEYISARLLLWGEDSEAR